MPSIIIELNDGRLDPIELQTPPEKTAAKVLDACTRKFSRGVGSLSPKDKPNLLLEDNDVVAGGVTYVFTPIAGSQGTSQELLLAMVEIKSMLQVHSVLQLDKFMYTEGKVTRQNDPLVQFFSRDVKAKYGALQGDKCWCLLTDDLLPSSTVIGSHLFKWEWTEYVHLLGFEDINDVRNGLPLWKPIEWAFDTSRLCFTFDKTSDNFIAKVMDPSILTKKLVDIGREKMGAVEWRRPPFRLRNLTFQDIDSRALEFDPARPLRPYKRVLNFQARQARTYAIRRGWQPASWDFEDYLTEGMELSEKLKIWYNSMH